MSSWFIMLYEAVGGHPPVKIVSDNTDVLVILAHHLHAQTKGMPNDVQFFMESCNRNRAFINVNEVVKKHAKIMPNLLAGHTLSGYDSVSFFAGIGQATVLK